MRALQRRLRSIPANTRAVLFTCVYGLAAGAIAVAFQKVMNLLYDLTYKRWASSSADGLPIEAFLGASFVLIVGTSLLVGFLLTRFCRDAAGSGIPQLKRAFWTDFGHVPWRVVWVKFVAGVLSIGGGTSLGREGPSVQLAGGLASNIAGWLGVVKQKRRTPAAAGAAGGLAAAFNTPLAAITFVLEEIITDLHNPMMGAVLLASVIGAFVVHGLIGKQPAFSLGSVEVTNWLAYALTPVAAVFAALVGVWFQKATLYVRSHQKNLTGVADWMRPAIGGVITWALGCAVFIWTRGLGKGHLGIFSLGYDDLSAGLAGELAWQIALVLLVGKFIATVTGYGFGGCGGIFSPTLFLGGMCGLVVAGLANCVVELDPASHVLLAVVGMSSCLGAVVRAPLTGMLIVFEMTHEFALVPALMIGALLSQAISRRMTKHNFYDALLIQDGHNIQRVIPPRDLRSWQQLPVSSISNFQPVILRELTPEAITNLLAAHTHERYPVVLDRKFAGVLTRKEGMEALAEKRPPKLDPTVTCRPNETIRDLQGRLIESPVGMVVLMDQEQGKVIGVLTLHDLLRAELSLGSKAAG